MSTVQDTMSSPTSTSQSQTQSQTQSQIQPPSTASKQKIKFACDSCARYKVACPKQQPECERCVSKGRRCTYSVACRNGKPKKNKPKIDTTKSLPSPAESWTWPNSSPFALSDTDEPLSTKGAATNKSTTSTELPELAPNNSMLPLGLTSGLPFTPNHFYDAFWTPVDYPMTSVEPNDTHISYPTVSMYPGPNNYFPPAVHTLAWPRQATSPLFTSAPNYIYDSSVESTPSSGSSGSYSPTADAEHTLLSSIHPLQLQTQTQTQTQTHDSCFARTYNLLHTLKRPSSTVCSFSSTDQNSTTLQPTIAESIDKILLNTDKATEHIISVMQCSCHTTSSVRCALTLALFEVISWYETIVRELNAQHGQREQAPRPQSSASSDEDYDSCSISQRARSDSNGSNRSSDTAVLPVVSIGDMQLRHADVKSVVGHLVLTRIQKVRGIVQNLGTDRDCPVLGVERLDNVTNEFMKMQNGETMGGPL